MNAVLSPAAAVPSSLPKASFELELEPGAVKKLKTENRRSDAMIFVRPSDLYVIPGFNVRIRDESYLQHLRAIAENMRSEGFNIDKPISVVAMKNQDGDDVFGICNGHTRHEAALLAIAEGASFDVVPVVINAKTISAADMTVDLVRSNSGRPLSTYETAIVVKRLANMDFSEAEISRKLVLAPSYINGLMLLAAAPNPLAKMVMNGQVAAALAIEMIRKHGATKATELLRRAADDAKANGQSKVTAASLPERRYSRAVQKAAPQLLERTRMIQQDPGFQHLSAENQAAIETLLAEIAQLAPEPEATA